VSLKTNPLAHNGRLALMLLTLSLSSVFLFMPDYGPDRFKQYDYNGKIITIDTWRLPEDKDKISFFPFNSKKLFPDTYAYLFFEHLILVILAYVIWQNEPYFMGPAIVYFVIQSVDLIFFVLSYGEPFRSIPITWNMGKTLIFLFTIMAHNINGKS
jgi:hypothetical protein